MLHTNPDTMRGFADEKGDLPEVSVRVLHTIQQQ